MDTEFEKPKPSDRIKKHVGVELSAFCDSVSCQRAEKNLKRIRGHNFAGPSAMVFKDVKAGTFECPDCGCALYWQKGLAKRAKVSPCMIGDFVERKSKRGIIERGKVVEILPGNMIRWVLNGTLNFFSTDKFEDLTITTRKELRKNGKFD